MNKTKGLTTKAYNLIEKVSEEKELVMSIEADLRDLSAISKEIDDLVVEIKQVPEEKKKELKARLGVLCAKLSTTFELDTHTVISDAPTDQFKILSFDFCNQLIQEFECDTPSKKAMAEVAASCFIRYLRALQLIHKIVDQPTKQSYITVVSKELDRSYRGFISTVALLKQFNNPEIELKITTKNAFIAKNQQINSVLKNENNESK